MATYPDYTETGSATSPDKTAATDPRSTTPSTFQTSTPGTGSPGTGSAGSGSQSTPDVKDQARAAAHDVKESVKDQAHHVADDVKEQARTQLAGQKEKAAEQLSGFGDALQETSKTLRDNDQNAVADYVERAADQIGQFNHYLRNHTVGELIDEAERYARREPALFLGAAALVGLAASRFFRASGSGSANRQMTGGFSGGSSRSGGDYQRVHNTAGAMMPQTTSPSYPASPQATQRLTPVEGRING